jgi:hypothetical protein
MFTCPIWAKQRVTPMTSNESWYEPKKRWDETNNTMFLEVLWISLWVYYLRACVSMKGFQQLNLEYVMEAKANKTKKGS